MTLRRLGALQWIGLLGGAAVWAAQHLIGLGVTQAECSSGGERWGIENDVWQGALLGASVALVAGAAVAAALVVRATRNTSYEAEAPPGRIRFLAIAALVANLVFVMIIVLDGAASIVTAACRQG